MAGQNAKAEKARQAELYVKAISNIVASLVSLVEAGKPVALRRLIADHCAALKVQRTPKQVDILAAVPQRHRKMVLPVVRTKPVRSSSGVAIVAVMSKPHVCPHVHHTGNVCVYCPGGPDSDFEYSTQSYTGFEPTSMRAIRARYDPLVQARVRVEQLRSLGHAADKIEFIVMGGTFMSLSAEYRDGFISSLHDALSGHSSGTVDEAVRYAEHSMTKCVGITIETRPDFCKGPHINSMLVYGCTRIEIGVQSIYEDVARDSNRGHTVADVADCFRRTKDAGFKIVAHLMPDLPKMGQERDMESFREFFENPAFRGDGLKIYPLLVIRGTGVYEMWRTGRYRGYPPDVLVDLLARMLALVPPFVRLYRVQRDIPMPLVTAGVSHGNLRQVVHRRMQEVYNTSCRDIRSREIGIQALSGDVAEDEVELVRRDYTASDGWETFLSYEDSTQDILIAMLRLRRCPGPDEDDVDAEGHSVDRELRPELVGGVSVIRELHVYGSAVPIHDRDSSKQQHRGYGTLLVREAERIALEEHGSYKISIISGIGVRNYYRRLGYTLDGPYMSKIIAEAPEGLDELVAECLKPTRAALRRR